MIKDCVNVLESEKLIVTSKNLKARLRKYHGTHFMNRHKYLIDVIMKCSEYFTNKVTVRIDHNENFTNGGGQKIVATFARILVSALETNSYNTTHIKFKNIPTSDMTLVIIMIAILPTVAQRTKTPDDLPALYFYGNAKTGKNYLFKQHAAYHNVPTIHTRVSRYNQQINETGFFLKDLNSDTLIDPFNSATIRSLALGNKTTVTIK